MTIPSASTDQPSNRGLPPSGTRAFICGLSGLELTEAERAFLRQAQPWGVILFARNVDNPGQVRRLTGAVRDALGWHAPILVDQEGGRVQRLKPPHWQRYPPAGRFGVMERDRPGAGVEAAQIATSLLAEDLRDVGITVNCAPVLDLRVAGGTNAIGNRAIDEDPNAISAIGRVIIDAHLQAGIVPVIKHIPGHGRAVVDSHIGLPQITVDRATLEATDFLPFHALCDAPMAMTGHLVFQDIDPDLPATLSPAVIAIIRNEIGFDGVLMTDDLSMGALSGTMIERTRQSLDAGCDLALHCNGRRDEMEAVAEASPLLEGQAAQRCARALQLPAIHTQDRSVLAQKLDELLAPYEGEGLGQDPTAGIRLA